MTGPDADFGRHPSPYQPGPATGPVGCLQIPAETWPHPWLDLLHALSGTPEPEAEMGL